jgi:hypothetical protein
MQINREDHDENIKRSRLTSQSNKHVNLNRTSTKKIRIIKNREHSPDSIEIEVSSNFNDSEASYSGQNLLREIAIMERTQTPGYYMPMVFICIRISVSIIIMGVDYKNTLMWPAEKWVTFM